jgi:hypothetical protein
MATEKLFRGIVLKRKEMVYRKEYSLNEDFYG